MKEIAPNNSNLMVGGIRAMFQLSGTTGYVDLGHIASHGLNRTVERGIFESDRTGVRQEVYSWLKKRGFTFEVEAPETARTALRMALMADAPATQSQTSTSITDEAITGRHDKWVRTAARKISSVVLTNAAGSTTYTLGTDYEVDAELGAIRTLSTGTTTDAQSLLVDYARAAMTSLYKMNPMQTSRFAGILILKMVAENGFVGEFYFPSVEVEPKGDLAITTDGPMKTGAFSIKILYDSTQTSGTEWGTFYELTAAS